MIKSKSDANVTKSSGPSRIYIKDADEPQDEYMEDATENQNNSQNKSMKKSLRSQQKSGKTHDRKRIILEYTRSTHQFKVSILKPSSKPKQKQASKTQALKIDVVNKISSRAQDEK